MEESSNAKHVAAFLGAPVGAYALAAAVWVLFSEECRPLLQCVPVGAVQYSLGDVLTAATVLAFLGALGIEIVAD